MGTSPHKKKRSKKGRSSESDKATLGTKVYLLTWLAIASLCYTEAIDPFGAPGTIDKLSAQIYTAVMSPFYGTTSEVQLTADQEIKSYSSKRGQSEIITIIIDDESLQPVGEGESALSWPMKISTFKRLLRKLDIAGAQSVFVDIYFNQSTPERSDEVNKLFNYVKLMPMKVIFGTTLTDSYDFNDEDITANIAYQGCIFPPRTSQPKRNPDTALAQMMAENGYYAPGDKALRNGFEKCEPTAAFKLYQHWCDKKAEGNKKCQLPDNPLPHMHLQWGYAPNDVMTEVSEFGGSRCQKLHQGFLSQMQQSLWLFFRSMLGGLPGLEEENNGIRKNFLDSCPYSTQINLKKLNFLKAHDLEEIFKDKIVLIGASLRLHPDLYYSPVHGYVPGVFYHAMALDNLLEYGYEYKRSVNNYLNKTALIVAYTVLLLGQALFRLYLEKYQRSKRFNIKTWIHIQMLHGFLVLALVSIVVLSFVHMDWSPEIWLGIISLMLIVDHQILRVIPIFAWGMRPFKSLIKFSDVPRLYWKVKRLKIHRKRKINRRLNELINGIVWLLILVGILIVGFSLSIVPHAMYMRFNDDSQVVYLLFLTLYTALATYCFIKIGKLRTA